MQFGEVRVSNIWIALPGVSGARLETADRPDLVTSPFVKGRPAARLMSLGESKLSSCGPNMVGLLAALVGLHDHFQNQNGTAQLLRRDGRVAVGLQSVKPVWRVVNPWKSLMLLLELSRDPNAGGFVSLTFLPFSLRTLTDLWPFATIKEPCERVFDRPTTLSSCAFWKTGLVAHLFAPV